MKKTSRNQNMPDLSSKDKATNRESFDNLKERSGKPERFIDSNLNQSGETKQKYDDITGTVENGIG